MFIVAMIVTKGTYNAQKDDCIRRTLSTWMCCVFSCHWTTEASLPSFPMLSQYFSFTLAAPTVFLFSRLSVPSPAFYFFLQPCIFMKQLCVSSYSAASQSSPTHSCAFMAWTWDDTDLTPWRVRGPENQQGQGKCTTYSKNNSSLEDVFCMYVIGQRSVLLDYITWRCRKSWARSLYYF